MSSQTRFALILLAKYPEGENVKTRLAVEIGEEKATQYYRKWLVNSLSEAAKLPPDIDIFLRLGKRPDVEKMQQMLNDLKLSPRIKCMQPTADNITDNLKDAYLELIQGGYKKVVSFATDLPNVTLKLFMEPFDALDSNDIVIGVDRKKEGINAFGVLSSAVSRKLVLEFFNKNTGGLKPFEWVKQVLEKQKGKLRPVYIMPKIFDVDTLVDLKATQA